MRITIADRQAFSLVAIAGPAVDEDHRVREGILSLVQGADEVYPSLISVVVQIARDRE